jgi:hypothetical protein
VKKLAKKDNGIENAGNSIDMRSHKKGIQDIHALVKNGDESIHQSRVLYKAVYNYLDVSVIDLLLQMGGDLDLQDENGQTVLHLAAASNSSLVPYLISKGANKDVADFHGMTALDYLVEDWKASRQRDREDSIYCSAQAAKVHLESVRALMPSSQKQHLHEGWLSPRMHNHLLSTAEQESDALFDGHATFSYIPCSLNHCLKKTSFLKGYRACMTTIADVLRRGMVPTVERVTRYSHRSRQIQDYLQQGGKIEYALDAIFQMVAVAFNDNDLYEEEDEDFQELPETVLDDEFELASVQCINLGGGKLHERGPYGGRYQDMPHTYSGYDSDDGYNDDW